MQLSAIGNATGPGAREAGTNLKELIAVIRRRKTIILATALIITSLTALIAFRATPEYTATSAVMIEPRQTQIIDIEAVVQDLPPDRAAVDTQIRSLRSRSQAEQIVEHLELLSDAEFNPVAQPEADDDTLFATVMNWFSSAQSTASELAGQSASYSEQLDDLEEPERYDYRHQLEATTRRFLDRLTVSQGGESYIISIGFTSTDPEKAALIANAVAELYVKGQLNEKLAVTQQATSWLAEQVQGLRDQVIKSENAIEQYRAAHELMDGRGNTLDAQRLASLNLALIEARTERAAREAKLQQVRELSRRGTGYESLAEVMASPIIVDLRREDAQLSREQAQLAREYGQRHPRILEVQAERRDLAVKIEQQVQNIIRGLEDEVTVARSREAALRQTLEEAKAQSAQLSQASVQLRELEREAEANRSLYAAFLGRLKETHGQAEILQPGAKVISTAEVPTEPSFPKPKLMTAVGFTASLLFGTLLAFLYEHVDSRLRTGRQLEQFLGVTSFGLVPSVRRIRRRQKLHHYLIEKPLSAYAEAVRAVQKGMQLASTDGPPQVVLLTSSLPREGKTTLAVSLAAMAARSGLKAAVVDLDLRHPSVAREMDQSVGSDLIAFMAGEATLDEVTHIDTIQSNLDFIPVKQSTSSSIDLLESPKMASLLATLRAKYQYVVLDAPPALGISDAKIAALLADAVLFVVRWEKTKAEVAQSGLEALAGSRVDVTGVVLTRVNLRRHAGYGYGDVGSYYGHYKKYYVN